MCKLPIDARVIAIDETVHYTFPVKDRPYIEKVLAVYLYDANERTHLCELTPSHYMYFLYNTVIPTNAIDELSDEQREALYDLYEIENFGENQYMHCSDLERLAKAKPKLYLNDGNTGVDYDESDYNDQIDGLIEGFNGNPPF